MTMKTIISSALTVVLFLGLTAAGHAMSRPRSGDRMTVEGMVRIVGNEPFTSVVLTMTDAAGRGSDCLLVGPLAEELRKSRQSVVVKVEGSICDAPHPGFHSCLKVERIVP